jgi:hypothetical protein
MTATSPAKLPVTVAPPDALVASLFAHIFGTRVRGPLADPRLEVLRAISASLAKGVVSIGGDLLDAARRAGWTADDLLSTFPGAVLDHNSNRLRHPEPRSKGAGRCQ